MDSKLITIIVPTYNMEAYLDRCLSSLVVGDVNSLLMQELEVIVVNDGSTDSSSAIAHQFEDRFPATFKVIDKSNGNYGSCINVALPQVKGRFVKILDADDWYDTDVFVEFMTFLKTTDVDMVYSAFDTVNPEGKRIGVNELKEPHLQPLPFADHPSCHSLLCMHGVTYRRALFDGLDYHQTEGIYYTDTEWIFLPMARVKTFTYFPKVLYRYFRGRPGQTMNPKVFQQNQRNLFLALYTRISIYQSCLKEGGKWNGIDINIDYIRHRCIMSVENEYFYLIARQRNAEFAACLSELDDTISKRFPEFYKELDNAVHPNNYFPRLQLPFRVIRSWHRHGPTYMAVLTWIVNHYMGLSARTYRLMKFLSK